MIEDEGRLWRMEVSCDQDPCGQDDDDDDECSGILTVEGETKQTCLDILRNMGWSIKFETVNNGHRVAVFTCPGCIKRLGAKR